MNVLDFVFLLVVILNLFIFILYLIKPKLFINWKYRKYLINIPLIITVGIVLAYSIVLKQSNKSIVIEYMQLKTKIDSISIYETHPSEISNKDSFKILLEKENQLNYSEKKVTSLITEKKKIDNRIGSDNTMLDSLNQLQIRINDKLKKIKIEKTQYYKNENRVITHLGKVVKHNGKTLVTNVKVLDCLYDIEDLTISSNYSKINSTSNANVLINLKFTITQNSGYITDKSIDSLIYLAFKFPNGNVEKHKNNSCSTYNMDKQFSNCVRFDKLPHVDSMQFLINIAKIDTGNYQIDFFTKHCKMCEYKFKLD